MCKIFISYVIIRVSNFGGDKMRQGTFKYHLKNEDLVTEFNGACFFYEDKNILVFREQNGTQVFVDFNRFLLTRENNEMLLVMDFNGGQSYINMKKMNQRMPLSLSVVDKKLESNRFMVNYTLSEQNKFEFILEWILGGE